MLSRISTPKTQEEKSLREVAFINTNVLDPKDIRSNRHPSAGDADKETGKEVILPEVDFDNISDKQDQDPGLVELKIKTQNPEVSSVSEHQCSTVLHP